MPVKGGTMPPEQREKIRQINLARYGARTHRRCPKCELDKPIEEFRAPTATAKRLRAYCPPCQVQHSRAAAAAYRRADPARAAARQRRTDLRINFGITEEDYDRLLAEQDGRCAICRRDTPGARRRYFAVDHDHVTGQVRGLLCIPCNTGIGHLGDDLTRIRAAAAYLERHQVRSAP